MSSERLDFSYNWNKKLNGNFFTTLRLSGRFKGEVEVFLKDKSIGLAEVVEVKRLENVGLINAFIAGLDTGYNADECRNILKRMYPKITDWTTQPIYFYLLHYTAKNNDFHGQKESPQYSLRLDV